MDRILIILKKENGPRASSAPALGLNTIIFKYVYWYMKQISGERLQDHWSSGSYFFLIMNEYDQTLNPNILIGHYDLISWFSDFALYLNTEWVYDHISFTF